MIFLQLFYSFFLIGIFTLGGGYASLSLIQEQIVEKNNWLTSSEYVDLIAISQMTPGPIALNAATFVGQTTAGFAGSISATLGYVTPSFIIVITLAYFIKKSKNKEAIDIMLDTLRPSVTALIMISGFGMAFTSILNISFEIIEIIKIKSIDIVSLLIFTFSFFLIKKFKLNPIYIIIFSGILGIILYKIFK